MNLVLTATNRNEVFHELEVFLHQLQFKITVTDFNRPWGGFFVIDEQQAEFFSKTFFPEVAFDTLYTRGKLSPKLLAVEPSKRLSWQYHYRRAEIWKVLAGTVGIVTSLTDQENEIISVAVGGEVRLTQGQRHRLIGLREWGVLAEIWQHTDPNHPSDELDIVRVQDDFGR